MKKFFSTKNRVLLSFAGPSKTGQSQIINSCLKIGTFQPQCVKFTFYIDTPSQFMMLCKKELKVLSLCKLWFHRFGKKQRYSILVNLWIFIWTDLQLKSKCWFCYCWKTSWIEYFLHWALFVSPKQNRARRWAPEHVHFSFQVSPWWD